MNRRRKPRRNPGVALVGIGRFVELAGETQSGEAFTVRPRRGENAWLAWKGDPESGDLLIVDVRGRVSRAAKGDEETVTLHRAFHDAEPSGWRDVAWHPPTKAIRRLGFARAITYRTGSMPSNKQGSDWVHAFGDFGGGVDERHDPKRWPVVAQDAAGSLFLLRRPGVAYRLADWLIG